MVDQIVYNVIKREGGFVNSANDHGGATKYGITAGTLSNWRHLPVMVEDVERLTESEAADIYQELYINRPRLNLIKDDGLRAVVFDTGVNNGTATAIRILQQSVGAKPDGVLGAVTLGAIAAFPPKDMIARFLNGRQAYDNNIVARNPSQEVFAAGWKNRIDELRTRYA